MNSITFNLADDNMPKISKVTKLGGVLTRLNYRIYGLKTEGNPPVLIRSSPNDNWPINNMVAFFANQKIKVQVSNKLEEKGTIHIGLRKDVRQHPALCAAILQTIVYGIEKRMNLDLTIKIPGIPKINP